MKKQLLSAGRWAYALPPAPALLPALALALALALAAVGGRHPAPTQPGTSSR
jgi:hypothetical protein